MIIENRQQFIKKLLYQSSMRGCKETDLIIGGFAKTYINDMSDKELLIFNDILKFSDVDFYDWYTGENPIPEKNQSELLDQILKFKPISK